MQTIRLACLVILLVPSAVHAATGSGPVTPSLRASDLPSDEELARLVWDLSPDLATARARVVQARADLVRAKLLPNPAADVSWNTIPIGSTNPSGLGRLTDVPNYSLGLSTLIERGKREPRRQAAEHGLAATAFDAWEILRQRTLDAVERLGEIAVLEVRIGALDELSRDAARLATLELERSHHGQAAGLDSDRAELEADKFLSSAAEERRRLGEALLACARVVGVPCTPFGDPARARAFLARRTPPAPPPATAAERIALRPDLASLRRQEESARAALRLALARSIPDPTVRVGYTYDTFLTSGNQGQSAYLGVSIPLPLFDRGQADAAQASASAEVAVRLREITYEQGRRQAAGLAAQAVGVWAHRARLTEKMLPLAHSVVDRLEAAVAKGGATLSELLLARRTLDELLLDEAELELEALRITVGLGRLGDGGPTPPTDLREAAK